MKIEFLNKPLAEISADFEAILVVNKDLNHKFVKDKDKFEFFNYKGDKVLVLPEKKRIYIGIKELD